jgi:predicted ester cyclase
VAQFRFASMEATAIIIVQWRDGKIAESWNEFDAAGMMRQLSSPGVHLRP